jgi:threonine synthase
VCQQFDWQAPDWIVIPGGNLGNASALYAGFKMMKELGLIARYPRLIVAQAEHANPLYLAWKAGKPEVDPITAKPTQASAIQIGNPVSAPRAMRALEAMNGIVEQASEQELADVAAEADATGMYTCPHTAVALAALKKLLQQGVVNPNERVVAVSTAHGLKFTEFKHRYHEGDLDDVISHHKNPPLNLPADYGKVVDAIRAHFPD